jgi:hypothetical protein
MKQSHPLSSALLFERAAHGPLSAAELAQHAAAPAASCLAATLPAQAADVLLAHGRIRDPRFYPEGPRDCLWIAERDWIYRLEIPAVALAELSATPGRRVFLHCLGLDTLADLYLDGARIADSRDMYLPLRVDITEQLRARAAASPASSSTAAAPVLLVHFHSPHAWIAAQPLPAAWEGRVHANRLLRKPHEDFNSFNGAFPYFTPTGIYDEVRIEFVDTAELVHLDIEQRLDTGHAAADLVVAAELAGVLSADTRVRFTVRAPDGAVVASAESAPAASPAPASLAPGATATATARLRVESPALWWPLGYGDQPLYEITAELVHSERKLDRLSRRIGLREFALGTDFHLRVNGVPVKLWGANLAPLEQFSHVWPAERVSRLLDHVVNAHCVTLRLWGPGAPYGDNLYDECDRRGILVWSEFYHTWGMYPDTPNYYALCRAEAEQQVRRLKHHASVFMWCGGNEVHMGSDLSQPGERVISRELYHAIYPEVCRRLDPSRYYHIDSPVGGAFPNDPDHGDTHGYTHFWFVRGCDYPLILTENARWSPPGLKTLRRYIPDPAAVWPEGFVSRVRHRRAPASGPGSPSSGLNNDGKVDARDIHEGGLLPPAWQRLGKDGNITNGRAGPIGDFYDTGDTPEGLIHRHGSAHALFMRREIERLRRGRPAALAAQPRRTQGHYWWRLNGTWPLIETELIDYLLEPKMAYYAFRRAQAPLLLSYEFGDRIHLWLTNDTARDAHGTVRFELLRMGGGAPVQTIERRFTAVAGRSDIVTDLDALGMFRRDLVLSARFLADDGAVLADTTDFAYQERNIVFPDARLSLRTAGPDAIVVSTDTFARCVELAGAAPDGDAFGWDFEDNFFDLRPGEEKRVRLRGRHRRGTVTARGFFCTEGASLGL